MSRHFSTGEEYAALAADYDRRWRHYLAMTHARTLAALAPEAGERILDVACGTGLLLSRLASMRPDLRLGGVDASAEMLARARKRLAAEVSLERGDVRNLPFAAGRFEALASANALHYLDDPARAVQEAARVLAPGGRLIVTDWCGDFLTMRLYTDWLRRRRPLGRILRSGELRALGEAAGLRTASIARYRVRPAWGLMTLRAEKPAASPD